MPGLIINDKEVLVPGLKILNWRDDKRLARGPEDGTRRNTKWVRNIILHTTKGIPGGKLSHVPQKIVPGGRDMGKEFSVAKFWSGDPRQSGAHIVIDTDGSIGCLADLKTIAMYHAGNRSLNHTSIGIEIYQLGDGTIYQDSLDACVKLVEFLCRHFGIQRQIHWPYRGRPTKRLQAGGSRSVGVFGHRDLTRRRGKGDPGDAIMEQLMAVGFESFDLDQNEDKNVWKQRQEDLGLKPDGVPGPHTVEVLKENNYLYGLWTLGRVLPEPPVAETGVSNGMLAKLFSFLADFFKKRSEKG